MLKHTITHRVGRYLGHMGFLEHHSGNCCLAPDAANASGNADVALMALGDFDEVVNYFREASHANPGAISDLNQNSNPASNLTV